MIWNNILFLSLNIIKVKIMPYCNKGILKHYHYFSDPKVCTGIVAVRRIPCSCYDCTTISFFFFFWSGLRCPEAYSLWGGVVPSPSIG